MIFKLRVRVLRAAFSREWDRENSGKQRKDIRSPRVESTPIEFRVLVKKTASRWVFFAEKRHNTHKSRDEKSV
jgi:hypothetical protein